MFKGKDCYRRNSPILFPHCTQQDDDYMQDKTIQTNNSARLNVKRTK